ncbi:MAG: hypothetical protein ACLFUF_02140 [Opitutales bacterium]
MIPDPRVILLFAANALLLHLTLMVNSALAPWSLYLVLLGPLPVLPAFYLRHGSFFLCTFLTGLWTDAILPVPFGCFTISFLTIGTLLFQWRIRFHPEHNLHPAVLAHMVNFLCILILFVLAGSGRFGTAAYWLQTGATLLVSHLVLLVIAPWFFNFERSLFLVFRTKTAPRDLPKQ